MYIPVAQLKKRESGYIPIAQLKGEGRDELPAIDSIDLSADIFKPLTAQSTPAIQVSRENIFKVMGQGVARQWAATGAKIAQKAKLATDDIVDPKTFFGISPNARALGVAIFGKEEPFNATSEDVETLETFGADPEAVKKFGGSLTILFSTLDVLGAQPFKGVVGLIRALKKADNAIDIARTMKSVGFADDVIETYKDVFVPLKKTKEVKTALDAAIALQSKTTGKGYRPVADLVKEGAEIAPKVAPDIAPDLQPLTQKLKVPKTPQELAQPVIERGRLAKLDEEIKLAERQQDDLVRQIAKEERAGLSTKRLQTKLENLQKQIDVLDSQRATIVSPDEPSKIRGLLVVREGTILRYEEKLEETRGLVKKTAEVLKNKAKNVAEKKAEIVIYAKARLSPDLRGRLLSAVASANTDGAVARAVRRINELRNNEIKQELTDNIEKMIDGIDALPPNQKRKAVEAIEGLTTETFSKKTQAKLAELKEFIAKEPEAVFRFGPKTIKKAERAAELGKVSLEDAPIRILIKVNDRLEYLTKEGKLAEKTTEEIKQLKVDNALKEITESAPRNLDEGLPPPRKPGEPVSTASFSGARDSTISAIRKGTQYYATPDVGFQILDNDKQFGKNYRIFKRPIDIAQDLENEMRNEIIDNLFKRLDDVEIKHGKLNTENYERVMLYATMQQTGGRAKLQKSDSRLFTDAFLDGIKLTEGETEFYKLGREIFDELRPHIEDVLWKTRGEELGKVDNYWSWITDFDNSDELFMRLSGDYKLASRTEQSFTKTRTLAGTQKLNLNALDVLVKHINDSATFIAKEELLNHLSKIAKSDEYAKAVGKTGQRWVAGWLDLLARGGVPKGYKPGVLTRLVRSIGHGVLGFRISPIVKQPLAKIVSVGLLGADALKHDPQFFTDFAIRDAIHQISKQQAFRNFDDPAYTALAKAKRLAKWQEWGYKGIKTFDSWTADSVWYAAYRHNLNQRGLDFSFSLDEFKAGKIDNESKEYADLIVRRTQGGSEYKDAPLMYASQSNKDLTMAFLQFQRFIHNQSILWRDAKVALIKEKDPIKAAAITSSLIAAGIAESYVQTGISQLFSSEDYAEKEREKSIGARVFNSITGQLPVISNLTSIAEYGGSGVPAWDVFRQGYQGAVSTFTAKRTETKVKGAIRAGEATATLGGISGAGQVGQILRRFIPEAKKSPQGESSMEAALKQFGLPPLLEPTKLPALPKLPALTP